MAFIDSLRLLAALLVVFQHLFEKQKGLIQSWLIPLAPGVAGVAVFFFISGYVIPMSTRKGLDIREFAVRRLFRIYPLYLTTLALMAVAGASGYLPKFAFIWNASPAVGIANILLIADYVKVPPFLGISWTLAVELAWYAIFAASLLLFGRRAADRLDVAVPVSLVAIAVLSLMLGTRIPLGRPTMIYAAVVGFQCYRFSTQVIDAKTLSRSILIFGCTTLLSIYVAFGVFAHPKLTLAQAIIPWTLATALFLSGVLYRPTRQAWALNHGPIPALGAMSYSIYLLHPLATATARSHVGAALQVPAAIALTLACAWAGYTLVEKPGIRVGRAVSKRWTHPATDDK